ncbi:MAG: hypothetical protein HN576_02095 [Bacteriovoracaceae bacterium]|jgi:shikimate dehydrogenase|nr:hypothetical protein [Bacteriovoracaceae bacterium]
MISLSLLGKDISHSKSHELYEKILKQRISYTKYDVEEVENIPTLDEIFLHSDGLSITSPYKKHFLGEVIIQAEIKKLNAINCIRKKKNSYEGTNTDYLALKDIFVNYQNTYSKIKCEVLGDGSMSQVTQVLLLELKIPFTVTSRKIIDNLNTRKLSYIDKSTQYIVVNSCSRAFEFSGEYDTGIIFLDYNYDFVSHKQHFKSLGERYVDGIGLLKSQAEYALDYWGISK